MQACQSKSYRTFLNREFDLRRARNPAYSLRAFARDLEIPASKLSEVLNSKRGLSPTRARQICIKLALPDLEANYFMTSVDLLHARSERIRREAARKIEELEVPYQIRQIELDRFATMSQWQHTAILDLVQLADFESDSDWIADRLSIPQAEAQTALDRLLELGFLERDGDRITVKSAVFATTLQSDVPSEFAKKYHVQVQRKSQDALYEQSVDLREFNTVTMAIDREKLPEAKLALREFCQRFCQNLEKDSVHKTDVYALGLQFFALTKAPSNDLETA